MVIDNINDPLLSGLTCRKPSAFDDLASHHTRVKNVVSSRLDNSDEADDVVQEVFLSALKNLKGFRGQSRLSTWLTQIAINKCHSH